MSSKQGESPKRYDREKKSSSWPFSKSMWTRDESVHSLEMEDQRFRPLGQKRLAMIGDESVHGVKMTQAIREVSSSEHGFVRTSERLDDVGKRFRRVWLFDYLEKLKAAETAKFFQRQDGTGDTAGKGILVVYSPRDTNPADSWEVKSLFNVSMKATKHFRLAIFFMSSDRTIGWWCSEKPEYLAVCYVRGIVGRVKGVRACGRVSLWFEPDAMFTGYMEMTTGGIIECRLGHASQLYTFGSENSEPTIALLISSVVAALIAFGIMLVGRQESDDSMRELTLAGILVVQGRDYWPGFCMTLRTCALGAAGGVTGILESKRYGDLHKFIHRNELPFAVFLAFLVRGDNGWRYLVGLIIGIIIPVYWSAVLRNRSGEGGYFGRVLCRRKFEIADPVPEETDYFGRRPIFTRREDEPVDEIEDDVEDSTTSRQERHAPVYPPAYARGFNSWDIGSWAVGKTPGYDWSWKSRQACMVYALEVLLACLAEFFGTIGSGIGVFADLGFVSVKEGNGSEIFLRRHEKWLGLFSTMFSSFALSGILATETEPREGVMLCGFFIFVVGLVFSFLFEYLMKLLVTWSSMCSEWRMSLADGVRKAQGMKVVNISSTGDWNSMNKCRRMVRATYPRVDGFSYYDGELFNVHPGWYFPACGRVSLSVPIRRGQTYETEEGEEEDSPRYVTFDRTRVDGLLLGPSVKKKSANACAVVGLTGQDWLDHVRKQLPSDGLGDLDKLLGKIDANVVDKARQEICELLPGEIEDFFPEVVLSYATGYQESVPGCQGPGKLIAAGVIKALFRGGCQVYSDLLSPAANDWKEYKLRLCSEKSKAKVLVVLMTKKYFQSINCLREIAWALAGGCTIVPVRVEEISRDGTTMWPTELIEEHVDMRWASNEAKRKDEKNQLTLAQCNAREALSRVPLPANSTLLSYRPALQDLVKHVQDQLKP